jgi:hypothetical protein
MSISKKNSKLDLVKPKASIRKAEKMNVVMNELRQKITELGSINGMYNDVSFIHHVCSLVENLTQVTLTGPEKKALVVSLIIEHFPQLDNENGIATTKKTIDFLCDIGVVEKIATSKVVGKSLIGFLSKHLL